MPDPAGAAGYHARMELTPELFEKTEFTERRKGYDIDQVETFLEETGTALAQLLARTRHTEERAAHAEARLAQADAAIAEAQQRAQSAEQRAEAAERSARDAAAGAASAAASAAADTARLSEEAEVEQAARTLLMAKRTADATINEARGEAQALLEDSQSRAQRQLDEANAEASELVRRAAEQAEAEYADRRDAAIEEVHGLEGRRSQLADVITQLESRLAGYREELGRAAQEIVALAEDPSRLGARPNMSMAPDEVLTSDAAEAVSVEVPSVEVTPVEVPPLEAAAEVQLGDAAEVAEVPEVPAEPVAVVAEPVGQEPSGPSGGSSVSGRPEAPSGSTEPTGSTGATATAVITQEPMTAAAGGPDARYVDLTSPASDAGEPVADDRWGPGSWAEVEGSLDDDAAPVVLDGAQESRLDQPTEAVGRADQPRDRYLEELDSAVNEAVSIDEDDEAMTAFFQGTSDSRSRRFGWRR
jgi:hypothetical protein